MFYYLKYYFILLNRFIFVEMVRIFGVSIIYLRSMPNSKCTEKIHLGGSTLAKNKNRKNRNNNNNNNNNNVEFANENEFNDLDFDNNNKNRNRNENNRNN